MKDELSVDYINKVALRGTRIVVPKELQNEIVKLSHDGHREIARKKLRSEIMFIYGFQAWISKSKMT